MARLKAAFALLATFLTRSSALQYQLIQEYNASNIFDEFNFFNGSDPTGGFVQYVPFEIAASTPLIGNTSDLIYIGVDSSNVYTPGGVGRPSVRLESKTTFTEGLFVIDLTHIPVGCGIWPALWTTGLADWPADGEIDIIENVNDARINNAAIHATGNCSVDSTLSQTGIWKSTDCNIGHDDNQGCGTAFTEPFNYGSEFNANGGGVYAMEWTSSSIQIWFFPPDNTPSSIQSGDVPDPDTFGTPSASFSGPCSSSFGEKFFNHSIVIDTTFCGGWAGSTFGSGSSSCPLKNGLSPQDSCVDYVANNPEEFKDAFWGLRSLKVWEKVPGFTVPGLATPKFTSPTPIATVEPVDVLIKEPLPQHTSELVADDAGSVVSSSLAIGHVTHPTTIPEDLNVSPLTGGVLNVGNDSDEDNGNGDNGNGDNGNGDNGNGDDGNGDNGSGDNGNGDDGNGDDGNRDDGGDILDAISSVESTIDSIIDKSPLSGIDTILSGIKPINPGVATPKLPVHGVSGTLKGVFHFGGRPSVSLDVSPVHPPFGFGNTEGHEDIFPPQLSLPLPTKRPRIPIPIEDAGIVPPHLRHGPPGRRQSPFPSSVVGVQIPSTLPLLLPNTGGSVNQPGLNIAKANAPNLNVPVLATPSAGISTVAAPNGDTANLNLPPVQLPPTGKSAGLIPFNNSNPLIPVSNNTAIVPSVQLPPTGKSAGLIPSKNSNPLIPASNNTAIVPSVQLPPTGENAGLAPSNSNPLIPAISNAAIVPSVQLPPTGENAGLVPSNSNPLIPAIGNAAIVPPSISDSPIVNLWSSFRPELKNKLIAAATKLPTHSPGSNPLSNLWASLSPELKSEVLSAANNLHVTSPNVSAPTISDLINAASSGKIPNIANLPGLSLSNNPPAVRPHGAGGLLGFLDAKTKKKLKALIGQATATTEDSDDLRRRQAIPLLNQVAANDLQPIPSPSQRVVNSLLPVPLPSQVVANNLQPASLPSQEPANLQPTPSIPGATDNLLPTPSSSQGVANNLQPASLPSQEAANLQPIPSIPGASNNLLPILSSSQGVANNLLPVSSSSQEAVNNLLPVPLSNPAAANDLQAYSALLSNTVPDTLPQAVGSVVGPVSKPTPNAPVTPLNSSDTTQAMTGLLSFLDNNTKAQIADLLFTPDSSTGTVSRKIADAGEMRRRWGRNKPWHNNEKLQTWNEVAGDLRNDTITRLDNIIKLVTNNINDTNINDVGPLKEAIDSINVNDRYTLARFLTGNKDSFDDIGSVVSLLLLKNGETLATELPDILNAANNYTRSPNGATLGAFMEILQDSASSLYDASVASGKSSNGERPHRTRDATSDWTPQDKLALAQNVYSLCPSPALAGIPFPSPNDLAVDLMNPKKSLEEATSTFERKLQAYFDLAVQGCWTKIKQWLAWRQLLHPPGTKRNLFAPKAAMVRMRVRQVDNQQTMDISEAQSLVEQQIYTICPEPDTFSTDDLIADLEDPDISIEIAISKFQNKLWAYMAKLQSCSDKIKQYGPLLKSLVGSDSSEPILQTNDNDQPKRLTARHDLPDLFSVRPATILNWLASMKNSGVTYKSLPFNQQKAIYDAILAGFTSGQPIDSHTLDQLQDAVIGLTQATQQVSYPSRESAQEGSESSRPPSNDDVPGNDNSGEVAPGILKRFQHAKRQSCSDENGVISDADTPPGLDKILGPHGTLDPFGSLGPQVDSPDESADTSDPHDQPDAADDTEYDLPDSAVDQASPEVDAVLDKGEYDPFGQLVDSEDVQGENKGEKQASARYLEKLKDHEQYEEAAKYLGDPRDLEDFMDEYYGDSS